MIIINKTELGKLSFPDFTVTQMVINLDKKVSEIFTDGAVIDDDAGLIELDSGKLVIKHWQEISIREYQADISSWVGIELLQADKLKDICEEVFDDDIVLRGFGYQSGLWLEYKFIKPEIMYAEFDKK
ncbi:MAG: hypothetical protein CENE_03029 [Candidatus Celerinatantimonas neptuna]|nr:MAG: hypothetical protein CENE_03015 [Candidatus Celerinatantimonas neptuna]CAG9001021.1 MAG: hypothetical protein CENE_03029 [Candidatus Celerinatantimonas neptuna]